MTLLIDWHNLSNSISSCVSDLSIEHDLGCPVPPGGHVLSEDPRVVMAGVTHTSQSKVTDLQVAVGVQEDVGGLEVPMEDIGRVYVFESSENLIEKVANVVRGKFLRSEQFVEICLHQALWTKIV